MAIVLFTSQFTLSLQLEKAKTRHCICGVHYVDTKVGWSVMTYGVVSHTVFIEYFTKTITELVKVNAFLILRININCKV